MNFTLTDLFVTFLSVILVVFLTVLLKRQTAVVEKGRYDARAAWMRGGIYFVICFLVSWFSGIAPSLLQREAWLPNPLTATWGAFAAVCLLIIIVGYFVIWPMGTETHGRPLSWPAVLVFGLLWGLSQGQLFASIWSWPARYFSSDWVVVGIAFIVIATFNGLWHSQFWDIYVSPIHNIEAWNLRKVLLVHVPNLLCTLTFLTLYRNVGLFVALQTLALVGSAYFMHFPPFWGDAAVIENKKPPAPAE